MPFPTWIPGVNQIDEMAKGRRAVAKRGGRGAIVVEAEALEVVDAAGDGVSRELLPPPPKAGTKDPMSRARREVEK